MKKAFASVEALLALLFASAFFAASLSLLHQRPDYYSPVYRFQLTQDLAQASVSDARMLSQIRAFATRNPAAEEYLSGEYSALAQELGDYCIELSSGDGRIRVNCERMPVSRVSVSRIIFDGHGFKEVSFTIGFYG